MTDGELARYIGAVEKVRSSRAEVLDDAMRRKIAEELGLSPEDLAAATAAGEAALTRAEGLIASETWDEAIRNLTEADALLPADARVAHALARAFWGRHRVGRSADDRARALAESRRCLELDPRHPGAIALISEIEARPKLRRGRRRVLLVAGLAVAGAAVAGVVTFASSPRRPVCPDGAASCTVAVPLHVDDLGDGVEVAPAVLEVSSRGLRLDLSGRLTHRGDTELGLLRLGVRLLEADGSEVGHLSVDAQPEFAPALRPGDSRTFYLSEMVPPGSRRVAVNAGARRTEPAAASYGPGQAIPVAFASPPPSHIGLAATYRSRTSRSYEGKSTVEGVLEVQNNGQGVIRELEIELQGRDADGKALGDPSRETIAYPIMPPMLPGERRTVKTFIHVAGQVASEALLVTKAQ